MWGKNDIYFADFETLTFESKQYQEQKHTDVWLISETSRTILNATTFES